MGRLSAARRLILGLLVTTGLCAAACRGQEVIEALPDAPTPQNFQENIRNGGANEQTTRASDLWRVRSPESVLNPMQNLANRWLLGSAVPRDRGFYPLSNGERFRLYLHQTFFSAASYADRAFGAGFDQARGVPSGWGGGMEGFGRRLESRYGQFVIRSTLKSAGDAALGYEPRYDLCRCDGFWQRTKHAVVRNFVTYDSTGQQLPQLPLFGAAFVAGMTASTWKPGPRNVWAEGGYAVAGQAGWGILTNWLSEFSGDISKKISRKHSQ